MASQFTLDGLDALVLARVLFGGGLLTQEALEQLGLVDEHFEGIC